MSTFRPLPPWRRVIVPSALLACAFLAFSAVRMRAQQAVPPAAGPGFVFHANVGEVLVQANVEDKKERSIDTLPQSDFTVFENGVLQTIASFSHEDSPVSVGILVDNSGSMKPKRIQVDQAALNFVRASNPQDEVFIVKFNDEYHLAAPFTNSIPKLEQGLGELDPSAGTALYDALISADTYLARNAKRPKQVLLLITDGEDDASTHSLEQTLRAMQAQNGPVVYCIGLVDKDDSKAIRKDSQKILQTIADTTGGMAYFPRDLDEVDAITRKVASDIRMQYSLVYRSNQTTPGYRSIHVVVKDPHWKDLTAHTRTGYYQPEAMASGPGRP